MPNAKHKGRRFEREVAKMLSRLITGDKRSDILVPTTLSGGVATRQGKKGEVVTTHQAGDLAMSHADAALFIQTFSVECKRYATVRFDQFVQYETGPIATFWEQCERDALAAKKFPLLVFQQDRGVPMVGLPVTVWVKLNEYCYDPHTDYMAYFPSFIAHKYDVVLFSYACLERVFREAPCSHVEQWLLTCQRKLPLWLSGNRKRPLY